MGQTVEKPELIVLNPSYEGFGMVMDLLSRSGTFAKLELGDLSTAVRLQLRAEHHFGLTDGRQLLGYIGWMETSEAIAKLWVEGMGPLTHSVGQGTVALTIVSAGSGSAVRTLIRAARLKNKGKRVYFKRAFEDGERPDRKGSVLNYFNSVC